MLFKRRPRRNSRSSTLLAATAPLIESLERRTLMCALDIHDDPTLTPAASYKPEDGPPPIDFAAAGGSGPDAVSIVWANRGVTSGADDDRFDDVFGSGAETAREVVDAVIDAWERTITSFNFPLAFPDIYALTVKMDSANASLGASASVNTFFGGMPIEGTVTMGRGSDTNGDGIGDGANWFIDPTPNDDSEFLGTITNAFAGNATVGGPAAGLSDFYTVLAAEMTHCMGITSDVSSNYQNSGFLTDTNIPDTAEGGGVGTFFTFVGPSISHLMTSNNAGPGGTDRGVALHTAGPGVNVVSGPTFTGAQDTGNAGYETGRRYLVPNTVRLILDDSYGYDTVDPESFGTFYSVLNEQTGQLTVRGGTGTSQDVITISTAGSEVIVSVDVGNDIAGSGTLPGTGNLDAFVSTYDFAQIDSILIEPGDGDDTVTINDAESPVTINAGGGNDFIEVGDGDIDSNLDANVSVVGDAGTDTIWIDDTNDGIGGDDYYLTVNRLEKDDDARRVYYETIETMFLVGSDQSSVYDIAFLPAGLNPVITAGSGDDTFNVASGDIDTNLDSDVFLTGGGGTDTIIFNDTTDGQNSDSYELTANRLTKAATTTNRSVEFNTMQSLVLNGSDQTNTYNVLSVAANLPVTINGGSGNETFNVADDDLDSDIASNVTINGNAGTDTINFDDSGDAAGNDTYSVGQLVFTKNTRDFRYDMVEAIHLTGSPQNDDFQLNGSLAGTVITLSSGQGNDDFILGNNDLGTVLTGFILQGQGGTDSLVVNDTIDTEDDTYTLTDNTFSKTFAGGGSRQFAQYAGMESFGLWANPHDNTINVQSTNANTPVTILGSDGNDTFNIGLSNSVNGILGTVQADGMNGTDTLNYNDQANASGSSYTVAPNDLLRTGVANTAPHVDVIVVNCGSGSDTISAVGNGLTTVNARGGDDIITAGGGLWDFAVLGALTVNGGIGSDTLIIDDTNDTGADAYTVTSASSTKNTAFAAPINYATIETYQLDANADANVITVNGTFDGDVKVRGRGGDDDFVVLDNFAGRAVVVEDGLGLDIVRVNSDSAGTAAVQFDTSQDLASLSIFNGGTATLAAGGGRILNTQSLGISANGALDLTDNVLVLDWSIASPINAIKNFLTTGHNGGAWNGAGIRTSLGNATNVALGYAESSALSTIPPVFGSFVGDAVLVRYTRYGDADLTGNVNSDDFNRHASSFGFANKRWSDGNFNYDAGGLVNSDDFNLLASNFGQSGGASTAPGTARGAASASKRIIDEIMT